MKLLKRLVLGNKSDSENYVNHLRKIGVKIGEKCVVFSPLRTIIDEQNPHMLEIGNNVKITAGVTILTHDFSWCVTSGLEGHVLGGVGSVKIGDNVFIGMNTTILKGSDIGDNIIIGANSLVSGKCESNSVYAGSPAKKITDIATYYEKRKSLQMEEAKEIACRYYSRTGKLPDCQVLREYLFLFKESKENTQLLKQIIIDSGHENICDEYYKNSTPAFDSLESFLDWCQIKQDTKE